MASTSSPVDAHRLTSGDRFGSGVKTGEATPQALGLDAGGAEPVCLKTPGEAKVSRLAGWQPAHCQRPARARKLHLRSRYFNSSRQPSYCCLPTTETTR